jgi:hypothetical protein
MATRRTSTAESHFIDAVARRVVELLESRDITAESRTAPPPADRAFLTVAEVAERYRVSRAWVYAHQRQLGALRMGTGPRAHLRFDPAVVAGAIAALADGSSQRDANSGERDGGRGLRLIPFEPGD